MMTTGLTMAFLNGLMYAKCAARLLFLMCYLKRIPIEIENINGSALQACGDKKSLVAWQKWRESSFFCRFSNIFPRASPLHHSLFF